MSSGKIIILPESWASRIAAGEVVERPASVVKELVENALDAAAKEVSVWIEESGSALIRVRDDGEGIPCADLPLAIERHSTSKLKSEADLFRIATLGFRGEALPSIASVSKLEIVSRPREEEVGCKIAVEGGKKGETVIAGCPPGTTVEVRHLFFNIPARRKFLRSPATELSHICDVINRMALARADIHFRLYHGGRALCDYPATSGIRNRLQEVLGRDIAGAMVPLSWSEGRIRISGFLSSAPSSFANSRHLLTYVNGRFVKDRILTHAVLQGYETLLMKGRYPAALLYLELPFEEVDVNVHPAKYEVRFRHQSEVHEAVAEAVRAQLRNEAREPAAKIGMPAEAASLGVREPSLPYPAPPREGNFSFPAAPSAGVDAAGDQIQPGFFSSLEILGQLLDCYLVCVSSRGLALIDQHAAHERAAFEKMRRQLERGKVERQNLLIPQILQLPVSDAALLEQSRGMLDQLGFTVEEFGPSSFAITAAPGLLPSGDYREAVRSMLAEVAEVGQSREVRQSLEERLMTIACHSVIRASRKLDREEMRALLGELDQIDFATQCPHGRPVLIEFTREQLERMFKRA